MRRAACGARSVDFCAWSCREKHARFKEPRLSGQLALCAKYPRKICLPLIPNPSCQRLANTMSLKFIQRNTTALRVALLSHFARHRSHTKTYFSASVCDCCCAVPFRGRHWSFRNTSRGDVRCGNYSAFQLNHNILISGERSNSSNMSFYPHEMESG